MPPLAIGLIAWPSAKILADLRMLHNRVGSRLYHDSEVQSFEMEALHSTSPMPKIFASRLQSAESVLAMGSDLWPKGRSLRVASPSQASGELRPHRGL